MSQLADWSTCQKQNQTAKFLSVIKLFDALSVI